MEHEQSFDTATNADNIEELEKETDFRNQLLLVVNSKQSPMHVILIGFLKKSGYYDKIVQFLPKLYVFCMRTDEGKSILEGLGVYGIITDFTKKE